MLYKNKTTIRYTRATLWIVAGLLLMGTKIASAATTDYWAKNFTTAKTFQHHVRQSCNRGWLFYKGNPSGTPSATGFSDASWQQVQVPHSPSYDAPEKSDFYLGVSWYRKRFVVPNNTPANKKVFIEFGGAMSTAQVWVNGTLAGSHETGGYTSFVIDISSLVNRTDSNVIAVKVDNSLQADVPPGAGWVDYVTFGGLYRNIWLHVTDPVYVPQWGQIITTPTVSANSALVKVNTTVVNDRSQPGPCSVTYNIFNKAGTPVSTQTALQTIPANGSYTFRMSSEIAAPALWKPSSPDLYKIVTTVSVDGVPVDDYVDRFGVRTIAWSKDSGFILNGSRFFINGANLAQDFAWVHAAVPVSRYYKMIESLTYAGFNLMRCSHFPRDPAFYDACDELGLLLLTEVPTWGHSHTSYSNLFWSRLEGSFKEMVLQGNNHPSIIGYGYFNEPSGNFSTYFATMKSIADSINPGLFKYVTNNPYRDFDLGSIDFYGNQYSGYPNNLPALATEYLGFSGATRGDAGAEDKYATDALNQLQNCKKDTKNAGGVLWSFRDYWGFGDGGGTNTLHDSKLGIVDQCFVPKRAYYAYRKSVLGRADDDNPIQGTATKVVLEPDLTDLRADGSDISLIVVALRDNNGKCIQSNTPVTLSLSGSSCTLFGPATVAPVAGKIGVVVRSTERVGATTISAIANGLSGGSTTITTYPAIDFATAAKTPIVTRVVPGGQVAVIKLVSLSGKNPFRLVAAKGESIQIYDLSGHVVASRHYAEKPVPMVPLSHGVYVVKVKRDGKF